MKRIISVLLAALLIFSLSVPAYAATIEDLLESINGYLANIDDRVYAIANYTTTQLPVISQLLEQLFSVVSSYVEQSNVSLIYPKLQQLYLQFKAYDEDLMQNYIPSIDTGLTKCQEWLESLNGWASSIESDTSVIKTDTSVIKTDVDSLFNGWILQQAGQYVNKNPRSWFGVVGLKIDELNGYFVKDRINVSNMTDSDFGRNTWYKGVYGTLYRLQQVLATDDDLQMRQDSEENKDVAKDAFLSYDSDTSVKPSDIGGLSNLGSGLRNNFDTGTVEASNLFDFWGSDNTFSWFTQKTKDNMVNVSSSGSGARRARAQNDEPIYYSPYGEHMEEYERLMREGIK